MAHCNTPNRTPEELRNGVKNREPFWNSGVATQEEILDRFHTTNDGFTSVENQGNRTYGVRKYANVTVSKTVSQPVSESFAAQKGTKEAERISKLSDNVIKQEGGTYIHEVNEAIMRSLVEDGAETITQVWDRIGSKRLNAEQFAALTNGIKEVLDQINTTQDEINSRNSTEGTATILVEQIVIDPIKDIGGTIDLLAVFSDSTASIYDYKVMMPQASQTTGKGQSAKLIDEFFPAYKVGGFNLQIGEYKRICKDRYGIRNFRQSRIIPIHIQYQPKTIKQRKDGARLTSNISLVQMGHKASEYLTQLPVGFEETGDPALDDLIRKQISQIEKIRAKMKGSGLKEGEYQILRERVQGMVKGVNDLLTKKDLGLLMAHIKSMMAGFEQRVDEPEILEDGTENPKYINTRELMTLKEEFTVYSSLVDHTINLMRDMRKNNPAMYKTLVQQVRSGAGYIQNIKKMIEVELAYRGMENVNPNAIDEHGRLKPQKQLGFFSRLFSRLSEIKHPVFERFTDIKDKALYKIRKDIDGLMAEIEANQSALFKWGKANNYSKRQVFELLVNKDTGNMKPKLRKEFWELRKQALEDKDVQWFKDNFQHRDEKAWKTSYKKRRENYILFLKEQLNYNYETNQFEDLLIGDIKAKTKAQLLGMFQSRLATWTKFNDLENSNDAWLSHNNNYYLEIKPEVIEENYSEEFKYIKNNKPLHDFYEMWETKMLEFRDVMNMSGKELPQNFIPNMRKEIVERFTNPVDMLKESMSSFAVREDDYFIRNIDMVTGEKYRQVPVMFMQPFKDADGNIKNSEKSYDLGRILLMFGKMAYNHQHMTEIEAETLALKDYLGSENYSEYHEDTKNQKIKDATGNWATKRLRAASDTYKLFERFSDYYLYGVKYNNRGWTIPIGNKEINTTKAILAVKKYFAAKVLGFAVIPGIAAGTAGHFGTYLMGKKGQAFSNKHHKQALGYMISGAKGFKHSMLMSELFDIYAEDHTYRKSLKLARSGAMKYMNMRTLFWNLRKPDEGVDKVIVLSMMRNFGLDAEGNLKRLEHLPKGAKSMFELAEYNEEKDVMNTDWLTEELFIQFRNAARSVASGVKGSMTDEDISQVALNLGLNAAMMFKTWMPGVITERAKPLRYNRFLDVAELGRYRAYMSEFTMKDGEGVGKFLTTVVAPKAMGLVAEIVTFGLAHKMGLKRVNEARSRVAYDRWKMNNPEEAENITYEMYLDVKRRQIKALMAEFQGIALLTTLIMGLSTKDDDDDPYYSRTQLTRVLFKTLNRAQSEMQFAYNPTEFIRMIQNPIPMLSILSDIGDTVYNTFDETRDAIFGEESPQDKTPWFYYSSQWAIGVIQLRRIFEFYEQDEKNVY